MTDNAEGPEMIWSLSIHTHAVKLARFGSENPADRLTRSASVKESEAGEPEFESRLVFPHDQIPARRSELDGIDFPPNSEKTLIALIENPRRNATLQPIGRTRPR